MVICSQPECQTTAGCVCDRIEHRKATEVEKALLARNATLEAALQPFAAYARRIDEGFDSQGYGDACPLHLSPEADSSKAIVRLGDCRRARDVLAE